MPDTQQPQITKKAALEYLRAVETLLYSTKVERRIKKLDFEKQLEFFSARLSFTAMIGRMNAALMREIREELQAQARSIKEGIDDLTDSLSKLEDAVEWARAVNGVTVAIGKVVSIF